MPFYPRSLFIAPKQISMLPIMPIRTYGKAWRLIVTAIRTLSISGAMAQIHWTTTANHRSVQRWTLTRISSIQIGASSAIQTAAQNWQNMESGSLVQTLWRIKMSILFLRRDFITENTQWSCIFGILIMLTVKWWTALWLTHGGMKNTSSRKIK